MSNKKKKDKQYDIAVVMINYNSSEHTLMCISSVIDKTSSDIDYQIIVIDNASAEDDYQKLLKGLSSIRDNHDIFCFRSVINTGFSSGNMLGIQFARSNYYFFLNNDCVLQNDCLKILYDFCEKNPNVALCSPQLYKPDGTYEPCIDYFPYLSTKIFGLGVLKPFYRGRFYKRKKLYAQPQQVDVVSGSQMFIKAEHFNNIGGFDTTFFLYCEEEDIAIQFYKSGYQTFLVPEAMNMHKGGGSTPDTLDIKKEFYISFIYFYKKHYGASRTILLRLILFLKLLRKSLSDSTSYKLAFFTLNGAQMRHSMKHKQKIVPYPIKPRS